MPTSKFSRYFKNNTTGDPAAGLSVWLVLQSIASPSYPGDYLECAEHSTRDGLYQRSQVGDGEYKIYIDVTGGTTPELYEENCWVGESRLTEIANHFDSADSQKLKTTGIKDNAITLALLERYAMRNTFCIGGGTMSFNSSTYELTWSGSIFVMNGRGGYCVIAPGNITLDDFQVAYVIMNDDRTSGSDGTKTLQVDVWNATTDLGEKDNYFVLGRSTGNLNGGLWDLYVSKRTLAMDLLDHTQNTDTYLDFGGSNQIAVADVHKKANRNSFCVGGGTVTYNSDTYTFTWSANIYVSNGRGGYGIIAAGSVALSNVNAAYITLDDAKVNGSAGTKTVSTAVWNNTTALGDKNNYILAARIGTEMSGWLWDTYKMQNAFTQITAIQAAISGGVQYVDKHIIAAGGGDYTSIAAALADITDASASNQYRLFLHGQTNEIHLQMKDYVHLYGTNRDSSIINGKYDDDEVEATIIANSVIEWGSINCDIKNLTILAENCRYGIHDDLVEGEHTHTIENCYVEHKGNDGADAYYSKVVWAAMDGIGQGLKGDANIYAKDCIFKGRRTGYYSHTKTTTDNCSKVVIENCEMYSTDKANGGYGLRIQFLADNNDKYVLKNCNVGGMIYFSGSEYMRNNVVLSNVSKVPHFNLSGGFPLETDNLRIVKNISGATLDRGMAVKYSTSRDYVIKMTDSDTLDDFAGIVMAEMVDDAQGYIKIAGFIEDNYISMSTTTTATFGDTFGMSATAGKLVKSATPALLKCTETGYLEIIK